MNPKSLLASITLATAALAASAAPSPGRVIIAPVEVAFDKAWLANMNTSRGLTRLGQQDQQRIAADMAASLQAALDAAIRARGFEVVTAPTAGATRLAASISDLYVNAPEIQAPGRTKAFVREAGRATLRAEVRDTATGTVRLQNEFRGTAGDTGHLTHATDVSNRFWFDALFRRWADDVAAELTAKAAPR